jgi:hypothetical protein
LLIAAFLQSVAFTAKKNPQLSAVARVKKVIKTTLIFSLFEDAKNEGTSLFKDV